jgi:ATP-dependent exoDNAse (exonuclease V) beta subunit
MISMEIESKHNELIDFEEYEISSLMSVPKLDKKQILFEEQEVDELKSKEYAYNSSISIPLKNSISKLLQKNKINSSLNYEDEHENIRFSEEMVSAAERGTVYHKFFEMIDFKDLKDVKLAILNARDKMQSQELEIIDESLIENVLNFDFFKSIQEDDVVLKEREFYAKMPANLYFENVQIGDEFIMQGIIDLLVIRGKDAFLLDYKTGKLSDEKVKNYSCQLNAYADVAERAFGVQVKAKYLCFIDEQKIIEI